MDYQTQDLNQEETPVGMRGVNSMSISGLIRNSALQLENECIVLQKNCEDTFAEAKLLKEICSTQKKNIDKLQSESEHLKLMIHTEATDRENSVVKLNELTEKIQKLGKHFTPWFRTINGLMSSREVLSNILSNKLENEEQQQKYCKHLETSFKNDHSQILQAKNTLLETKEKEKQEFEKIITHLKSQLEVQSEEERSLKLQLQELRACKKERVIMINTITPDCNQLECMLNMKKQTLSRERTQVDITVNQLRANLQELLGKKEMLEINIEAANKMLNEKNNLIRDIDMENKILDTNLKEHIAKEEEYIKMKNEELSTLQSLELNRETMKEKFASLLSVEEENTCLKLQCEQLENTIKEWDSKLKDIKHKETTFTEEIERQNVMIKKLEEDRVILIDKGVKINEKLAQLQKEINDNAEEHIRKSAEVDLQFDELTEENETLNKSVAEMELLVKDVNESKCCNEDVIENLRTQLEEVKLISEQSDTKLLSVTKMQAEKLEELKSTENDMDEMISRTIQEYEEAQNDAKKCEETKEHITNLETQIANNKETFQKSSNELKDSHQKKKEEKELEHEKQRIQYEKEYRIREQKKMDALLQLKETNLRISDIQQQKKSREGDINKIKANLTKCDNFLKQLESKLKTVKHAVGDASQSLVDPHSQGSNLLDTPNNKNRRAAKLLSPAGSDANCPLYEVSEDIDVEQLMKNRVRKGTSKSNAWKKTAAVKKKPDSDWGF